MSGGGYLVLNRCPPVRRVTPNLVGVFVGNASDPAPLRRTTSGVTGGDNSISRGGVLGRIVSVAMAP